MPRSVLVDTGPLIALFDRDDADYERARSFFTAYRGRLITSWAVITEVLHMLDFSVAAQLDFLEWLRRDALDILSLTKAHLARILELTRKYADLPMDFADATLVALAESEGIEEVLTLDSDFDVYRMEKNKPLRNVLI